MGQAVWVDTAKQIEEMRFYPCARGNNMSKQRKRHAHDLCVEK